MSAASTFVKTAAGQQELSDRRRNLGIAGRRLLILVNGSRNAVELQQLMGPKVNLELELSNLVEEGLIQSGVAKASVAPVRPAEAPSEPQAKRGFFSRLLSLGESAPKLDPVTHERMREACLLLHDALGPDADDLTMKLEECASPEELEKTLLRAINVVIAVRGKEQGEALRLAMALPASG